MRGGENPHACRSAVHRLRELREQAGLTQTEFADHVGVGQRQASKIEHRDLEITKIGAVCRSLATGCLHAAPVLCRTLDWE
ncbi:helix-turn-helix transcriptional regulator [Propionimicrobium sp. PCR01-08-3]|uniref:helix-turn-helix domain-containing protein n=1 Tax=Propionimicrobium sp. PCR01-08-3 TaxID=3052086 RepID=UPI003342307C